MLEFTKKIQERFKEMTKTGKLFRVSLSGRQVWDLYLDAFHDDPIFRDPNSSEHNCNTCNNFIRRYGNVVAIDENFKTMSLFDVEIEGEFQNVAIALSKKITETPIAEVFFETFNELTELPYEKCKKTNSVFRLGIDKNYKQYTKEEVVKFGVVNESEIYTFHHMHLDLPKEFVDMTGSSVESIMADFRTDCEVFQRGLETIPLDTLNVVKDLIKQGSLLNADEHVYKIETYIPLKTEYDKLDPNIKANWCWVKSYKFPLAKFRNELMGVLCSEISEGKDLNAACEAWNKRADKLNYKKAVAPFTEAQRLSTKKFIEEKGYLDSFNRRFAVLDDIKTSEIKHINSGMGTIKEVSIFDGLKAKSTRHKRSEFDGIDEVSIDKFMTDILPNCTAVQVFLTNKFEGNFVSLTTAIIPESKPMFKWSNNYSWTFNGNLAGKSQLTEMVENRGGRIDGVFRFTHSWNELEPNQSLMDLHVFMPGCTIPTSGGGPNVSGRRVGWNCRTDSLSGGVQDVDYTSPAPTGYVPVENITFPSLSKMPSGVYTCVIHNWNFRGTGGKGKAEIAIGGELYQYIYPATKNHEWVPIAEITLKNNEFSIKHIIQPTDESGVSKEIYGLETNQFHKVNLVCLSPNHWGENAVGTKHYMFMLENCKSPTPIRSFHAENLNEELYPERRVLEQLGNVNQISSTDGQLSGIGFNATVRDELVVKLEGSFKRTLKIKF